MGGFVSKVTDTLGITNYGDQAKAAKGAQNQQLGATREQIAAFERAQARAEERAKPFEQLGTSNIPAFQALLTPQGQMDYLQTNPMFQAAIKNATEKSRAAAAPGGKVGSGGLVDQLFQNYLGQGEQFIGNQFNRLLQPINIGQAASAGTTANSMNTATNVANVFGNQGDIRAAGTMARQNINNQALGGGLSLLGGSYLGSIGGGQALGGMASGSGLQNALLGAMAFSDRRLKRDIVELFRDLVGGVYKFRYVDSDQWYIGRMADELKKTRPDAVVEHESGYLMVTPEFAPRAA